MSTKRAAKEVEGSVRLNRAYKLTPFSGLKGDLLVNLVEVRKDGEYYSKQRCKSTFN